MFVLEPQIHGRPLARDWTIAPAPALGSPATRRPRDAVVFFDSEVVVTRGALLAPNGTHWELLVSSSGALLTQPSALAAVDLILDAPNGTRYVVTVDNTGALVTTATVTTAPPERVSLQAADGTAYALTVDDTGAVRTT